MTYRQPATTAAAEDFLEVVLGDPDLLAAEFAAIVAANWGPVLPVPSGTPHRPCYGRRRRWRDIAAEHAARTAEPRGLPARQRSPPDRDGRGPVH